MSKKQFAALVLAALFAGIGATYLSRASTLLSNIVFLLPPFLAVLAAACATRTYGLKNAHGIALALFATGLGCFFVGEFIFFLFQFVYHIEPFPSVADIFYLAAYPLLLGGFIKEITLHRVSLLSGNKLVLLLMSSLLSALAVIVLYFGVFLAYSSGDSLISNGIAIGYGIGDLILIVPSLFVLKIALDFRGGKLYNSWMLLLVAIMFMMAGDILFAINSEAYTAFTWPYPLIDLVWVVSYLLFAYSFFYTHATIKELHSKLAR